MMFKADLRTSVNTYRQGQLMYVEALVKSLDTKSRLNRVAKSAVLAQLRRIDRQQRDAASPDGLTRAHRAHVRHLIDVARPLKTVQSPAADEAETASHAQIVHKTKKQGRGPAFLPLPRASLAAMEESRKFTVMGGLLKHDVCDYITTYDQRIRGAGSRGLRLL